MTRGSASQFLTSQVLTPARHTLPSRRVIHVPDQLRSV
jgi:hypothetical protein